MINDPIKNKLVSAYKQMLQEAEVVPYSNSQDTSNKLPEDEKVEGILLNVLNDPDIEKYIAQLVDYTIAGDVLFGIGTYGISSKSKFDLESLIKEKMISKYSSFEQYLENKEMMLEDLPYFNLYVSKKIADVLENNINGIIRKYIQQLKKELQSDWTYIK